MRHTKQHPRRKPTFLARNLGEGVRLHAEISPCVFLYPGYPLQLTVTLRGKADEYLGVAYPVDRSTNADTLTTAAVKRLLASVRVTKCRRCPRPAFDPASVQTNRAGLCETCFLADLQADLAAAAKTEQKDLAARDSGMKKKGMSVRVTAWVHPDQGDDYQVDWYEKTRPTAAQVRKRLRSLGSSQPNDYQIIAL